MNAPTEKTNTNPRLSQASIAPTAARPAAAGPAMPVAQAQPGGAPDIGAMARRLFAHWQVVIVTLVIGAVVTAQVVRTRKPAFKSETVIFYREGISRSVSGPGDPTGVDLRALGTKLKETLLAQATLRQVIDEFHLYPDVVAKSGYADAVDQMRKKTEFKSRSQDTFAISFEGTNKDEAQKVCARMADVLIQANANRMADDTRKTTEFLEAEKHRADEELERTEREISEFLTLHPEFTSTHEALGTEVMAQQKKAEAAEADEKRRKRGPGKLAGGGGGRRGRQDPAPGAPATAPAAAAVDPVLIATRTQAMTELMNARKDLSDKSLKFTPQHPDVRGAQDRVDAAEAAVRRAEEAIAAAQPPPEAPPPRKVANIDDPYGGEDAGAAPAAPSAAASADPDKEKPVKRPAAEAPEKMVNLEMEWSRLQRVLGLVRSRQADLENKLYKAEMSASTAESGYGSTIAVLDPAYKPSTPSNAPNKTVVMIGLGASVAVGLVLSAAWGLFLDDRLFSAGEIETIVMVPVLGSVPRDDKKKDKKKGKGGKPDKTPAGDGKAAGEGTATGGAQAAAAAPKKRWGASRG